MSIQKYPCADCDDCIPIGKGEGLCDYSNEYNKKFIVDLFDVCSECPKPTRRKKQVSAEKQ